MKLQTMPSDEALKQMAGIVQVYRMNGQIIARKARKSYARATDSLGRRVRQRGDATRAPAKKDAR